MRLICARAAAVGAAVAALVTLPGLGSGTLWDNSETTYGEVAREIVLTHDWVVLHFNGSPWFVQPPLYFWIAALFAQLLGTTELAVRLPSALATIAMSAGLGYAVARSAGVRAGSIAAVVLATSLMQAVIGRLAIMDALLDLFVMAAILCWFRGAVVAGAVLLALGTLAKGPVAPAIVVLVIGAWLVWERRVGNRVAVPRRRTLALALAAYVAIVAPWFVAESVRVGAAGAGELLLHYTFGRYTGVIENQAGPWWYYVPVLILGFFPWIAFLPLGAWRAFEDARRPGGSLARLALVWFVVPFVFFSLAQTKLPNYVALTLPALAIIVALWFERVAVGHDRWSAVAWAATIPLFVGTLGFAIGQFVRTNRLESTGPLLARGFEGVTHVMAVGSLLAVLALLQRRWMLAAPYVLAATTTAVVLFIAFFAATELEAFKPIPAFARLIDAQRGSASVVAIHDAPGSAALTFYTAPGVRTVDGDADFVALICPRSDVYVVTHTSDAAALEGLALKRGRRAAILAAADKLSLLHVDGPACAGESTKLRVRPRIRA